METQYEVEGLDIDESVCYNHNDKSDDYKVSEPPYKDIE